MHLQNLEKVGIINSDIWSQCIRGDEKAFKNIYTTYYPLLYNFGLKIENDQTLVEDCIQELFLKLISNHSALPTEVNIKAYLLISLRNRMIDTIRQQKRFSPLTQEDCIEQYIADEDLSEEMRKIALDYKKLSKQQQEIIYLYYVQELTHAEISEVLQINYQSSKNLLSRAVIKLRKLFFEKKSF